MKENLIPSMKALMRHEGGFSNHPADPGGMTMLGVTQRVWEAWVGHPVDEKEISDIFCDMEIMLKNYITSIGTEHERIES